MKKCLTFVLLIIGCKTSEVDKPSHHDDALGWDYKPGIVMVDEPFVPVKQLDDEGKAVAIDKSYLKTTPKVGEILVVPGKLMHRVKKISSSGSQYELEVEPAMVTEVLENAEMDFTASPEWSDAVSLKIEGQEMLSKGARLGVSPIEFNISLSGIDYKVLITPVKLNGKIKTCNFKFQLSKGGSTSFEVEGEASLPEQKTRIFIENGKLVELKLKNEGITGNFAVRMATAGGEPGEHNLSLPKIALTFPIPYIPTPLGVTIPNPIPMNIEVGVQFVSRIVVPDPQSSASASSTVSFTADGGFDYSGSDVQTHGNLNNSSIGGGIFDAAANFGMPIDLQFGVAFPRIAFNVISQEVAFLHVGYTTGSKLTWGPLCKSGYSKVVVEGGYKLSAFGQTLLEGKKIFKEMEKRADSGCD